MNDRGTLPTPTPSSHSTMARDTSTFDRDDWEIDFDELSLLEAIGEGAYGTFLSASKK